MARNHTEAGKRWERDLREGLRDAGFDVESLRLAGKEDEGDMVIRFDDNQRYIVEAKNAKWDAAGFVGEAIKEGNNYVAHRKLNRDDVLAFAVVKRRNYGWRDAYVLTTVRELLKLE